MVFSSKRRIGLILAVTGIFAITSSLAAADDVTVSGTYLGNGKEAKLAYVSTSKGEPLSDKSTIVIVFSEKDHSKDKQPRVGAGFGKYGSALIITVYENGQIVGCEGAHADLKKSGFSSIGNIKLSDFKLTDGKIQRKLSTGGEVKTFGETWQVDVKFQAKAP